MRMLVFTEEMTLEFANELLITDVVFSRPERGVCLSSLLVAITNFALIEFHDKTIIIMGFSDRSTFSKDVLNNFCHGQPAPLLSAQSLVHVPQNFYLVVGSVDHVGETNYFF